MAFNISVPASFLEKTDEQREEGGGSRYISREFQEKGAFARIENWYQDVAHLTFTTSFVPIIREEAVMITRFYEELRLRAAIRDQDRREGGQKVEEWAESLNDVDFREDFYNFVQRDWPEDWRRHLDNIQQRLDQAIAVFPSGAFVKLSNRSPKDAALHTRFLHDYIRNALANSPHQANSPEAISEAIAIFTQAGWLAGRVTNGEEALKLLLMSERVHMDLHAHMLVLGEDDDSFNLNLIVREWCDSLDPMWEFRAFVVDGKLNACTIYSDFTYVPEIATNRDTIEQMIVKFWEEQCKDRIHASGYTIDFCVAPDLSTIKIVEINPLPPIAGTALFNWQDDADKKIINEGPFTFRVHMQPMESLEVARETVNRAGEKVVILRTIPAPLKHLLETCRPGAPEPSSSSSTSSCTIA